ncbi:5-formyltetrahydrofolate cyclo-ligase [Psittacicella hinzii]|uniref:5-formyltetrahydrofolate cyclo-ligase n=1 Tax=Psittacicella hinzii TaxID=2028575 RepID=A0A3A1Y7P5_9GAMM|nr:5-formyltetrahydrofolate cyclo-ligase [Psittacicella hinzii]RIY33336.1 5-formyltetrahydrofolate cyclo-ligase [Psittacicella hinzii]
MQSIEKYNILIASINAFKQQRHKLGQAYGLEQKFSNKQFAELDLAQYLNVDATKDPEQALANFRKIRALLQQEEQATDLINYKIDLRHLIKLRRQKIAHLTQETNLDFYVKKFFDHIINRDSILREARRAFITQFLTIKKEEEIKFQLASLEARASSDLKRFLPELVKLYHRFARSFFSLEQLANILDTAEKRPLINEQGVNMGRLLEIQGLAKADRNYVKQLMRQAAVDKEINIDFDLTIGGRDYYLLDTELPSIFYAYPNSHYLASASLYDHIFTMGEESNNLAKAVETASNLKNSLNYNFKEDRKIQLMSFNIDIIYNKRKKEHEQMFSEGAARDWFLSPDASGELVRAYLGMLNSQEFIELRNFAPEQFPEINFPFIALYQALQSELNAYFTLTQSAQVKAGVRKAISFSGNDEVLELINVLLANCQTFQHRYNVILQVLETLSEKEVDQAKLEQLLNSSASSAEIKEASEELLANLFASDKQLEEQGKEQEPLHTQVKFDRRELELPLSPTAVRYAQFLYGSNYDIRSGYIGLYFSEKGEFPTQNLIRLLVATGYKVALPVMRKKGKMVFAPVRSLDFTDPQYYKRNNYGILEPVIENNAPLVHNSDLLVVATPLVAFDRQLNRLGMGGGYYDRLYSYFNKIHSNLMPEGVLDGVLERKSPISPQFIGLAHKWQEIPYCYPHQHDLSLDDLVLYDVTPMSATAQFNLTYDTFKNGELTAYLDLKEQLENYHAGLKAKEDIREYILQKLFVSPAEQEATVRAAQAEYAQAKEQYGQSGQVLDPYIAKYTRTDKHQAHLDYTGYTSTQEYAINKAKAREQALKFLQASLNK